MSFTWLKLKTWRFTRKPEWPKDFKPKATVSQAEATEGFFAVAKPMRQSPGPTKPMDCSENAELALPIKTNTLWEESTPNYVFLKKTLNCEKS